VADRGTDKLEKLSRSLDALNAKGIELRDQKSHLAGQVESLRTMLKDKYGVSTVEDGRRALEEMNKQIDDLGGVLESKLGEIRGYVESIES